MIPLRDHNPSNTFPLVTYGLIVINVLVFFAYFGLEEEALNAFIETYAIIPAEIIAGVDYQTLLTAMFLHGGIAHLVGNMLFLHIFGDNLEDRLGHLRFLVFYLLAGFGASALQIAVDPTSEIPNIGASGAIAGAMGGYLRLFPNHRIDVLVPLGVVLQTISVPAFTMLFYWVAVQFIGGFGTLGAEGGGVAYFAHVGGFVTGFLLVFFVRRKD